MRKKKKGKIIPHLPIQRNLLELKKIFFVCVYNLKLPGVFFCDTCGGGGDGVHTQTYIA